MSFLMPVTQALRFLLELCALAALGYWGWQTGHSLPGKIGLGIGAPLMAALVWGLFVAPNASVVAPPAARLVIEVAIFGLATLGLVAAGRPRLAVALAVAYIIHRVLLLFASQ